MNDIKNILITKIPLELRINFKIMASLPELPSQLGSMKKINLYFSKIDHHLSLSEGKAGDLQVPFLDRFEPIHSRYGHAQLQ